MKKFIKNFIKIILSIILVGLILVGGFLLFSSLILFFPKFLCFLTGIFVGMGIMGILLGMEEQDNSVSNFTNKLLNIWKKICNFLKLS